jgi:hypothetical protein
MTPGDYDIITQSGGSGWFEDNHIGMGFDMLERILSCATHRIALSNVSYASHMLDIAHLASSKSENPELYDSLHDLQIDANAINKFTDKDFIVFPINDAYPRTLRQDIPGARASTTFSAPKRTKERDRIGPSCSSIAAVHH